jgi:hypothetical protein
MAPPRGGPHKPARLSGVGGGIGAARGGFAPGGRARRQRRGSPDTPGACAQGQWREIARHYVPTRTSTQVASHAQKHFIRQQDGKRKRRSSLFDLQVPEFDAVRCAHDRGGSAPGAYQGACVICAAPAVGRAVSGLLHVALVPCSAPCCC